MVSAHATCLVTLVDDTVLFLSQGVSFLLLAIKKMRLSAGIWGFKRVELESLVYSAEPFVTSGLRCRESTGKITFHRQS